MSVDKDKLENALQMLPIQQLREIIDERGLSKTSRSSSELIDAILADQWTEIEFQSLLNRIANNEEETEPLGFYIAEISEYESLNDRELEEELGERLLIDEVSFDAEKYSLHALTASE